MKLDIETYLSFIVFILELNFDNKRDFFQKIKLKLTQDMQGQLQDYSIFIFILCLENKEDNFSEHKLSIVHKIAIQCEKLNDYKKKQ